MPEVKAEEKVAKGLIALLEPVMTESEKRVGAIEGSQEKLAKTMEAFSAELEKCSAEMEQGTVGVYAEKLARARRRLKKTETCVRQTQDRIENIKRMHETLLQNEAVFRQKIAAMGKDEAKAPAASSEQ